MVEIKRNDSIVRMSHLIPPHYLNAMKVDFVRFEFPAKRDGSPYLLKLMNNQKEVGSIYECTLKTPDGMACKSYLENIKKCIDIRSKLILPCLPRILDFTVTSERDRLNVRVLTEPMGQSVSSFINGKSSNCFAAIPSLFFYAVKCLLNLADQNIMIKNIGPDYLYIYDNTVKFMDLQEVLTNKKWYEDLRKKSSVFYIDDAKRNNIKIPSKYKLDNNYEKCQVYLLCVTFGCLMTNLDFVGKINKAMNKKNAGMKKLLKKERKELSKKKFDWVDKFAYIVFAGISYYPGLCPSFEELYKLLSEFETIKIKEVRSQLYKCSNCGKELGKIAVPAYHSEYMICKQCFLENDCRICEKPHKFLSKEQKIFIILADNNYKYIMCENECTVGNSYGSDIGIVYIDYSFESKDLRK